MYKNITLYIFPTKLIQKLKGLLQQDEKLDIFIMKCLTKKMCRYKFCFCEDKTGETLQKLNNFSKQLIRFFNYTVLYFKNNFG